MKNLIKKTELQLSKVTVPYITVLAIILSSCGQDDVPTPDIAFDYVTLQSGVVINTETHKYYDDGSSNLTLTLYNVENSTDKTKPLVLLAPGGGFVELNKVEELKAMARNFAHRGYAAAVVNYSVGQQNAETWYDALLDIKVAIKFCKKNAAEFEIDPNKIFSGGWSSGGHLAIKAAHLDMDDYLTVDQSILHTLMDDYVSNDLEPTIYSDYSSEVKGNIILLPSIWDEEFIDPNGPALYMVTNERAVYFNGNLMWGTTDINGVFYSGGNVAFDQAVANGYVDGDDLELILSPESLDSRYGHVNHTVLDNMFYQGIAEFIQRNLD